MEKTRLSLDKVLLLCMFAITFSERAFAARCLYVSSYHAGYEWNDGVEKGIEPILKGKCELKKFYMDGRRHLDPAFAKKKAWEAKALIESWKPDVVIAADDNASKYLIMPYFKNAAIPIVFCGINWTVEPYGYPYSNTTGMIEVGPIEALITEVKNVVKDGKKGVFLSLDEITQHKEFAVNKEMYKKQGITLIQMLVKTMVEWEAAYSAAQQADFIIIGNSAGIRDWDKDRARDHTLAHAHKFTVAYLEWMAPYSMLTMAKIADEQGEWAAKAAVMILEGARPNSIPIVANRRWNMYVNPQLLAKAKIRLSSDILRKAIKVEN
jgi:hypothetical protein